MVAACKDECTREISYEGREWFWQMGSYEIFRMRYRQGFAFIGVSGEKSCIEGRSLTWPYRVDDLSLLNSLKETVSVQRIFKIGGQP